MSRVAVLMSGGVDSSCAAVVLKGAGHQVTGITARMSQPASTHAGEDDIYRAQRVCHRLGIPHIVLDLTDDFSRLVVEPFIAAYLAGTTPNPCARCNREIKLGSILRLALESGFERVATGHYAGIRHVGGKPLICDPVDRRKSQVYFLALVMPEAVGRLEFPLAERRKSEVRKTASHLNLEVRDGESQDLCFIPRGAYHQLLDERWDGPRSGDVLDLEGRIIGSHKGHYAYTIGQRFGLRGKRYYVVEKRAATNEIVVGRRQETLRSVITITGVNRFLPREDLKDGHLSIKYRYNSPRVGASIIESGEDRVTFATRRPCFAPAPGQIVACYWDTCLVCGGIIGSTA